jgi:hypothetical protein
MSRFDADEIEAAFVTYQEAAAHAGATGDWGPWVDLFTEDATYVEHLYGTFTGREEIRTWITSTMAPWPNSAFTSFPCEWHVVDADRGWVLTKVWNRLEDPGDGSVFEQYNLTILHYAGAGRWSHEEDIYNPEHFATVVHDWIERRRSLGRADGE